MSTHEEKFSQISTSSWHCSRLLLGGWLTATIVSYYYQAQFQLASSAKSSRTELSLKIIFTPPTPTWDSSDSA